jgi:predicted nuclease of predicted toxin-antitoxin system
VKLLLDENLSRRLVPFLQEAFPGSSQVSLLGMERAPDREIWQHAKAHDFVVVTNDADFEELSLVFGAPPHVIRLKGENLSKPEMLRLLTAHRQFIQERVSEGLACVEIVKQGFAP